MVLPPGLPITKTGLPFLATMVGDILDSILFSGSTRLGLVPINPVVVVFPGIGLKSPISLLSKKPAPSTTLASTVNISSTHSKPPSAPDSENCPSRGSNPDRAGCPRRPFSTAPTTFSRSESAFGNQLDRRTAPQPEARPAPSPNLPRSDLAPVGCPFLGIEFVDPLGTGDTAQQKTCGKMKMIKKI